MFLVDEYWAEQFFFTKVLQTRIVFTSLYQHHIIICNLSCYEVVHHFSSSKPTLPVIFSNLLVISIRGIKVYCIGIIVNEKNIGCKLNLTKNFMVALDLFVSRFQLRNCFSLPVGYLYLYKTIEWCSWKVKVTLIKMTKCARCCSI